MNLSSVENVQDQSSGELLGEGLSDGGSPMLSARRVVGRQEGEESFSVPSSC